MKKFAVLAAVLFPLFFYAQTITFPTPGSTDYTFPAGVTPLTIQAWGGGGAGGGSTVPGLNVERAGAGGGGGAYAGASLVITSGATLSIIVGAGGSGTAGADGGSGGTSTISGFTGSISAAGGGGGTANNAGFSPAGGLGGTAAASVGSGKLDGAPGLNGQTGLLIISGAGGQGANSGGLGGTGVAPLLGTSSGTVGGTPGGGGSGAKSSLLFSSNQPGGAGGAGRIIVSFTCPTYTLTGTSASVVNICSGSSSTITVTGNLPVGLYKVTYQLAGVTQSPVNMNVTTAGTGQFTISGLTVLGTKTITINNLTSGTSTTASQNCSSNISTGNTADVTTTSSGIAPVALPATGATCNQVTANWQAVAGATSYEIDVAADINFTTLNTYNVGSALGAVLTSVAPNTTFYYRVRAFKSPCFGKNSNVIAFRAAVTPLAVTANAATNIVCSTFTANWTAEANATSYLLDVSLSNTFATFVTGFQNLDVGNTTSFNVTGLTPNTNYYYRVRSKNGCGTGPSSATINAKTLNTMPATVVAASATFPICTVFTANWASANLSTSYLLDVSTNMTFTTFLTGFQNLDVGNVTSYNVPVPTSGATYYYRVRGKNSCGNSASFSNTVTVATSNAVPTVPTGVTSSNIWCTQFTMSWAAVTNAISYDIQLSTSASFPGTIATQTVTGITTATYTFTGLTAGTNYYYRVLAKNGCGSSTYGVPSPAFATTTALPATPTISPSGTVNFCQTGSITLTSSANTNNVWSTGETTKTITVTAAGSYTVKVVTTGGCDSAVSSPTVVTVDNLPTATAGGIQTICSNGTAVISGAAATNGTILWTINGGSGTLANATTLTPTYTPSLGGPARTIILTMTVSSNNTCTPQMAMDTYTINVQGAPTAVSSGSQMICPNGSAVVSGAVAANGTILWTHNGTGSLANQTTETPTYTAAPGDTGNLVTLTMTVTAFPACSIPYTAVAAYSVMVNNINTVGPVSSTPIICINTAMPLITRTTTGATGISNDGVSGANGLPAGVLASWSSNTITFSGTPTAAGLFNYSIPLTGGCGVVSATGTIFVNALPDTPISGEVVQPTCVIPTGSIVLHGLLSTPSWIITQQGTFSQTYNASGSTFQVSNLAPGNYSFTIREGVNCPSLPTVNIEIKAPITNTWNGTTWSKGSPPIITDAIEFTGNYETTGDLSGCSCMVRTGANVKVNSDHTLTIANSVGNNGGTLTFENNASLLQINDTPNSGNIVYKRNTSLVRRYDFTYWSSPVTRTPYFTLRDLSPGTLFDKFYRFDPLTGWVILYKGIEPMMMGIGYIVRAPQSYDLNVPSVFNAEFIGVPNNGLVTVPLMAAEKNNLIGNPYPSAIYADQFIFDNAANLYGSLYFWTHNTLPSRNNPGVGQIKYADDYAVYNLTGSVIVGEMDGTGASTPGNQTAPYGYIAAGQSFFVKSKTAGNAVFNNSMRVPGYNTQFFKSADNNKENIEKHRLWLNLFNTEDAFKQLLIGYVEGASNTWDDNHDGFTIDGNKLLDFYSINENRKLVIQGRGLPFNSSDFVPLGYKTTVAGDFTISIDHADGDLSTNPVYLEDTTLGVMHNLQTGNYTFNTSIGTFLNRFIIRYGRSLGTDEFEDIKNNLLISVKDKIIKLRSVESIKEVSVFDISGKLLYNNKKIGTAEFQISNLNAADQVLLVKTTLENGNVITRKIVFY